MKVNLNVVIVDLVGGRPVQAADNAGKPLLDGDGKPRPLTAKHAVAQCLLWPARGGGSPEDSHAAHKLAQRLLMDEGESDLSIAEINTVRANVAASWPPGVAGQVFDLFDRN